MNLQILRVQTDIHQVLHFYFIIITVRSIFNFTGKFQFMRIWKSYILPLYI